ncbi:hypothetical protein [Candidatus Enterococcus mangumiae]|uniref:Squalene cyclase C-terminal domain-containing protein n=1 Tax=Candidatus Enterococcus mangumiae TaxID=2230878 RepID=A0ABZ2T0E8_9ENTE|nr:hypothetical protein [Enterococcus sp. DIV1094]MBO0491210.1 hypothetical protein [Enterococcus sp. DIV1094]
MDTAYLLKRKIDQQEPIDEPMSYLEQSSIVKKYEQQENLSALGKIFALIGLAEIPYANQLPVTQSLIQYVDDHLATNDGFSYTGKAEDIVPCYNAMLLEAYVRLGLGQTPAAQRALMWIKNYQLFERNQTTTWTGRGICQHGGCLRKTPCYIGIGKSIRALITYQKVVDPADLKVNQMIDEGITYMQKHQWFKRLSNEQPISAHITENMFPQGYVLSLTDLVYIASHRKELDKEALKPLIELLKMKQTKTNGWKNEYIYRYNGYQPFSSRRQDCPWITEIILQFLQSNSEIPF